MSDLSPGGAIVSFGGTGIAGLSHVASIGYPGGDAAPVEAYEQILGQNQVVDLYNLLPAPRKTTFTCEILVRASDGTTDAGAAWAEVMAGYRAVAGLPETGTLVVHNDAAGSGTVSCTARRKPIALQLKPQNARHYVVTLTFTLTGDWA